MNSDLSSKVSGVVSGVPCPTPGWPVSEADWYAYESTALCGSGLVPHGSFWLIQSTLLNWMIMSHKDSPFLSN